MAFSPDRIARVNEILKREIADVIEKFAVNDGNGLVSVTKVHSSESLRNATVYVSFLGANEEQVNRIMRKLGELRGDIQHEVARHVILKYTPVLRFERDFNIEEGDRVLSLLRQMEEDEKK